MAEALRKPTKGVKRKPAAKAPEEPAPALEVALQ